MNAEGKNIVEHLFAATSLDSVSSSDLENFVSKYPYFGPTQFLLAKKFNNTNEFDRAPQLQKTALYFSNPYWLNYLLNSDILKGEIPQPVYQQVHKPVDEAGETSMQQRVVKPVEEELIEEIIVSETVAATTGEQEIGEDDEDLLPIDEQESNLQKTKLSSLIEQHFAAFKKPLQENETLSIKSSPFHTVDYFASQGIKADGQDNMATRVKKFTDWLKQMKGANVQPSDLGTDAETEQMIETIAQTSNETKEIVTEAMAEVLIKQGKTQKAILLYKKLSFLNPAKSTYFAAKIDALNS